MFPSKAWVKLANENAQATLLKGPPKSITQSIPTIKPTKNETFVVWSLVKPSKIKLINNANGVPITNKIIHITISDPKTGYTNQVKTPWNFLDFTHF
ncbi:hypothetical protein SCLARK_00883 [Spiroplasma clarkii]|nr:hypothetical protein SCLARK_00883 [Spiroplasma clarkii]